jgi:hypothetical protein
MVDYIPWPIIILIMKAIGQKNSEEFHLQIITMLKIQGTIKSPITYTKIVESKWCDNFIS